jgi:DNA invertase Pin-like site-specific DNA recombinase
LNVVGYVRVSRNEDGENGETIITQQDIIKKFAKENSFIVSKMYIDDNYSGYTFDRPALKEMLNEVKNRNINVILAKDASRLGRKNGQVLVLFDEIKEAGIRLILITEKSGGLDVSSDEDNFLGIKTWYNDFYVKDISRKIRANMHMQQELGKLIMGNHYGYNKIKVLEGEKSKFQLVVDEDIRPVIELIFESYLKGMGYKRICDILDLKYYPTPSEHIRQRHMNNGRVFKNKSSTKWQTHMIYRIISDDIYIGTLTTRKRQAEGIKGKQKNIEKCKQLKFPNNHEAIISKEDFKLAQEINAKRADKSCRESMAKYNYYFTGFIRCGDCGKCLSGIQIRRRINNINAYNCTNYIKYGKKSCSNHTIEEAQIVFYLKEFLKEIRDKYEDCINNIKIEKKKKRIRNSLGNFEARLKIEEEQLKLSFIQKIKDIEKVKGDGEKEIIESTYENMILEKAKKISSLKRNIEELKKINNIDNRIKSNIEIFDRIISLEAPNRGDLERILDKILVYHDNTLEFILKVNIESLTLDY